MIDRIRLIRNVGIFDSVDDGARLPLSKLALVYAENARGKTTLAAIFRSLATGAPLPITERHRLSATHPPHVVVDQDGGRPASMFQDGAWNQQLPEITVFDDAFVDENIYSGLIVGADHRQKLHELILGSRGVALNKVVQEKVDRIEEHNRELHKRADAIPVTARGALDADAFCVLAKRNEIAAEIQAAERNLAAAREQASIRTAQTFDTIEIPSFDLDALSALLARSLDDLDRTAADSVQAHLAGIGPDGETWVAEGVRRLAENPTGQCPFCAQSLDGSALIAHYRAYFSAAYSNLRDAIDLSLNDLDRWHGGDMSAALERAVRVWVERGQFWARFSDIPEIHLDTAAIARARNAARDAIREALQAKQGSPLEPVALSSGIADAVAAFHELRREVAKLSQRLQRTNDAIAVIKERAAAGNPAALSADVARLKEINERHVPATAALCDAYLEEKRAKGETEHQRDTARGELDRYREAIFPAFQTAINEYLRKFGASFRIDRFTSTNTRGGSSCTYNVMINVGADSMPVSITSARADEPSPSFRNTLSAGDRNTLALAFFFACLDQDADLARKVVVLDDPISSLDEHRSLTTIQEIRELAGRAAQVVVLSHHKRFLCQIWDGAPRGTGSAFTIERAAVGSTLRSWEVNEDLITEHDRRSVLFRNFIVGAEHDNRKVAQALRPHLERFIRVAYPECFPPGSKLGQFVNNAYRSRIGTAEQVLNEADTLELRHLLEYANQYHHDTNPAFETEVVNDTSLLDFVRRVVTFTRR